MKTVNKIYVGISVVLAVVLAYLAYRFLLKGNTKAAKEKDNYFKILDQYLKETLDSLKLAINRDWRVKIKLSACKHGVTFEQATARELTWVVEHNGLKVKNSNGEYTIPLTVLLQWRDARDGRSPFYGTPNFSPECTATKQAQIYRDEHMQPPASLL